MASARYDRLLLRVLRGTSDANIRFNDLRLLWLHLGVNERTRASHHLFRKDGVDERINLQQDNGMAKPYQVRQVRAIILKYGLSS